MSGIRETCTKKRREEVLEHRDGRDAYTRSCAKRLVSRGEGQVDHVLECQVLRHATRDVLGDDRKTDGVARRFSAAANDVTNLNLTSRRVNQSKKGPFTAALNRLEKGATRVDLEELARRGRASWLVDEGAWANVEREIVESYDAMEKRLEAERATRAHAKTLSNATEAVRETLERMGLLD